MALPFLRNAKGTKCFEGDNVDEDSYKSLHAKPH